MLETDAALVITPVAVGTPLKVIVTTSLTAIVPKAQVINVPDEKQFP